MWQYREFCQYSFGTYFSLCEVFPWSQSRVRLLCGEGQKCWQVNKASGFSLLSMMLALVFFVDLSGSPIFLIYWECLSWMSVGFCQMLFLHLLVLLYDFPSYSVDVMNYISWFWMLNQPCILGTNVSILF
jgi:hypothetical protein